MGFLQMKRSRISAPLFAALLATPSATVLVAGGCTGHETSNAPHDAAPRLDAIPPPPSGSFCSLPGSFVWTAQGVGTVPGSDGPDLGWMGLPPGFCAHFFGTVPDARQLRFAPGGELFVASPTTATTGGNYGEGLSSIVVLPDDDHDGVAEAPLTFMSGLASVQGLMFAGDTFYYQDGPTIRSVAYHAGDRRPSAVAQAFTTVPATQDGLHWPKVMDVAKDGTIYVTNGGSQGDQCMSTNPTRGSIFAVQPDGSTSLVAKGFRNPIALRCENDHNVCLAAELALDYSDPAGGREKLVPVRPGDDWGFPCCASRGLPYAGARYSDTNATPDCSGTAADTDSFIIGHTPFGLDFETGKWSSPWTHRVFVTLHGAAGTWSGARVVAIGLDPQTGLTLPATELSGGPGAMLEFATGWDDNSHAHGRPAAVAFASDGRLFLADDNLGLIVWIAPVDLMRP
jgi:glucose/arabinose dehydrogenase